MPLRPQTTNAKEKLNITNREDHPKLRIFILSFDFNTEGNI